MVATCPTAEKCQHPAGPAGYAQYMDWLDRTSRLNEQVKCPRCGLFAIWKRR